MEVSRGDLVTVVIPGDYGKPRPALVVQSDAFAELPSLTVLPLTSDLQSAPLVRLTVEPSPENGLERASQIMIDKAVTVPRAKIGRRVGGVDAVTMREIGSALAVFLGLG
ncbi:MAG TPA: type II toxin-antitoxin system PemK/MazF family toxin [Stellaceae bacterium]|nr:type II toxin-antitoxin system PemK/MazF family toxin [Stellaceae bacterium]